MFKTAISLTTSVTRISLYWISDGWAKLLPSENTFALKKETCLIEGKYKKS